MGQRQQLHDLLKTLVVNVYFQPPDNITMAFPCIVYKVDDADTKFADNIPYRYLKRYLITVMDRDPDSNIPDMVALLPSSSFSRAWTVNGLNHNAYNLYF